MKKIRVTGELYIYLVLLIILTACKFCNINYDLYTFWQPIIDDIILLILLLCILSHSSHWYWFSKRILYSLIFMLFINMYTKLFGMSVIEYTEWYFMPLIVMIYVGTLSTIIEIINKLYTLWRDGKIKFF